LNAGIEFVQRDDPSCFQAGDALAHGGLIGIPLDLVKRRLLHKKVDLVGLVVLD